MDLMLNTTAFMEFLLFWLEKIFLRRRSAQICKINFKESKISYLDQQLFCVFLITDSFIITALHCFGDGDLSRVSVGCKSKHLYFPQSSGKHFAL